MHRDIAANSIGNYELTAALLLPHELEHVAVPRPAAQMDESQQ
jgi:hypothetical protein